MTRCAAFPLIDYIAEHGVDHPHLALPALRELTHLFSAEFAIRTFLLNLRSLIRILMLSLIHI